MKMSMNEQGSGRPDLRGKGERTRVTLKKRRLQGGFINSLPIPAG